VLALFNSVVNLWSASGLKTSGIVMTNGNGSEYFCSHGSFVYV
jgi:hypothetical protein